MEAVFINYEKITSSPLKINSIKKLDSSVIFPNSHYDSTIGRWTTPDPKGFNSGSYNNYVYVDGDPLSAIDPEGTDTEMIIKRSGIIPHAYLHIFDPKIPGNSVYVDFGPEDGKAAGLRSIFGDIIGMVSINENLTGGFKLPGSYKSTSSAETDRVLQNAIYLQREAVRGNIKYNLFKFTNHNNATNCYGFANGL